VIWSQKPTSVAVPAAAIEEQDWHGFQQSEQVTALLVVEKRFSVQAYC
jgi:hypothetical protein